MNFIELAIVLAERCEKVTEERAKVIRTDKHIYVRKDDGQWEERDIPESPKVNGPVITYKKE